DKDKDKEKQPPRSALVMECFEAPLDPQQTIARLDVVSRHATSALYNALEYNRIPFRFIWMPLALIQEGLGGQTRAIIVAVVAGLSLLVTGLCVLPYPLRIDANGKMLPVVRRRVYPPSPGKILAFHVKEGDVVGEKRDLATLDDSSLNEKIVKLKKDYVAAEALRQRLETEAGKASNQAEASRMRREAEQQEIKRNAAQEELEALMFRTNSLKDHPGQFALRAPEMTAAERALAGGAQWTILTSDFKNKLDS